MEVECPECGNVFEIECDEEIKDKEPSHELD